MLKNWYFRVTLIVVIVLVASAAIAQIIGKKEDPPKLELTIKIANSEIANFGDMPVEIIFKNSGKETIRILNLFDSSISSKAFFSVTWFNTDGTPIFSSGGGKIAISEGSIKYVELKEAEEFSTQINLREFLPTKQTLESGLYKTQITYRNQYGEDCFKGRLESNKINIVLNQ